MPLPFRRRHAYRFAIALSTATALAALLPSLASAACPASTLSEPFTAYGDDASYSLVQGGLFESGAPGWSLSQSSVISGGVNGDRHALAIQPSGSAVSPPICVSIEEPSFRFFARQISGSWAVLDVILKWSEASGASHETTVAALQSGTSWALSPVLQLAGALPVWEANQTLTVKLLFKPEPYGGAWAIDDVYVDPYSR